MTDPFAITPPDPTKAAQWAGLLRDLLKVSGALLAAFGISMPTWLASISDPQITMIVSAAMMFAGAGATISGMILSAWDKRKQRQEKVATAIASAQQGTPLIVTVTPPGVDNSVARVSETERAEAPVLPAGAAMTAAHS